MILGDIFIIDAYKTDPVEFKAKFIEKSSETLFNKFEKWIIAGKPIKDNKADLSSI